MNIMNRTRIINKIIKDRGYKTYLEVGVENPNNNFNHIQCKVKESVDPYADNIYLSDQEAELYSQMVTYRMSSDNFFSSVNKKYDIIFIDAWHVEEQCDKDIYNALLHLNKGGCVVVHDVLPQNHVMQSDTPVEGYCWCGTVWKSILKLIKDGLYQISVMDYDYGIAVIEYSDKPYLPQLSNYQYATDFKKSEMKLSVSIDNYWDVVSYYTPLYHTSRDQIYRTYLSLIQQTDNRWEWVLVQDSELSTETMNIIQDIVHRDSRIRFYSMSPYSNGNIGEAKHRASMLCNGYILAELDHDDVLMPELTSKIKRASEKHPECGFFYCDTILCDDNFNKIERFPDGFALGYGDYYTVTERNPITNQMQEFDVCMCRGINPMTIRHIVGVPNHVRAWRKELFMKIGGYNRNLPIADDYELLVRTFLNTRMCYIQYAGYIQIMHNNNTQDQDGKRQEIQERVNAIANAYHNSIKQRFEELSVHDWVYEQQPQSADNIWNLSNYNREDFINIFYNE